MKKILKIIVIASFLITCLAMIGCAQRPSNGNDNSNQGDTTQTHVCEYSVEETFDTGRKYPKKLVCKTDSTHIVEKDCIEISTVADLRKIANDINAKYDFGCYTFKFMQDIDFGNNTWQPIKLIGESGTYSNKEFIFEGNDKTISNFKTDKNARSNSGFIGEVKGNMGIHFKNLTLNNVNVSADLNDEGTLNGAQTKNFGVGAFIGNVEKATNYIKFEGCKIINSQVNGAHWAGGFIGFAHGPADWDDLSINANITITGCTVENTKVTSNGSVGSCFGHATASFALTSTIENCTFSQNEITCTGTSKIKAGSIVGTIGKGTVVINNCVVNDVTAVSGGQINDQKVFGRFGDAGLGMLTIDGTEIPNDTPVS